MRNKIISGFITLILSMTVLLNSTAIAWENDLGSLSYWYSNDTNIGRWTSSPNIVSTKLNNNSSFYYTSGLSTARTQWNSALGLSMSISSSGGIMFFGGTKAELEASGYFSLTSSSCGYTYFTTVAKEGIYTYGNTIIEGYILYLIYSCVIDRGMSADMCKEVASHELGHALGYYGHYVSNSTSVMYPTAHENYTLKSWETSHLQQVY